MMLRYFFASLLLVAFAIQTFQQAVIVLDYYSNNAAFAKNCENKARPALHCNGKCQMMKKLQQEEKKDQDNPLRKDSNKNEVISSKSFFATTPVFCPGNTNSFQTMTFNTHAIDRSYTIFHPPALV